MSKKFSIIHYCVLSIAILLWVWLFRDFLLGRTEVFHDARRYIWIIREYLAHSTRGVYPFWNPFVNWGHALTVSARFFGEFNSLWWLIPLWEKFGLDFLKAYMLTTGLYYFAGLAGFYKLIEEVLRSKALALLGFVLLLYSPLSYTFFNDLAVPLLFVPAVWFAYWGLCFLRRPSRLSFWGTVFSLMVVLITYLPFYFITIVSFLIIPGLVLFFHAFKQAIARVWDFARKNKLDMVVGVLLLVCSLAPGVIWMWQTNLNHTFISDRHSGLEEKSSAADMHIDRITVGSIAHHFRWNNVLFWEQPEPFSLPVHMMLPVSLVFLLGLVAPSRYTRRTVLYLVVFLMLMFIALTDSTPILEFLYNHVFYFKMFRNLYYLYYLALPVLILVGLEQLRSWLTEMNSGGGKEKVTAVSGAFACLVLYSAGAVWFEAEPPIFHITIVLLGCAVVTWTVCRRSPRREMLVVGTLVVMTLLSGMVMVQRTIQVSSLKPVPNSYRRSYEPKFAFLRPAKGQSPDWSRGFQDRSGLVNTGGKYMGNENSRWLHENIPHEILGPYVRHKFVVYDNVREWGGEERRVADLTAILESNLNVALVGELPPGYTPKAVAPLKAERVNGPSGSLWVEHFDLNRIRFGTNYPDGKFVVYNDNMYHAWRVFVDGKKAQLVEANGSFKGVWIPSGKHVVEMRYGWTWIHVFYRLLYVIFFVVPVWLGYLYIRRRKGGQEAHA